MVTQTFSNLVSKYTENDPMLQFDIKENLNRLEKQSKGDSAFYFLAMLSFIEGYFRENYKKIVPEFDFNNPKSITLKNMFTKVEENIDKVVPGKVLSGPEIAELRLIKNFMRKHSNVIYDDKMSLKKEPTEFYIDGDRIRHCFCKQDDDNVRVLVNRFVEFSKIF